MNMQTQVTAFSPLHPIVLAAIGLKDQKIVANWLSSTSNVRFVLEDDLYHDLERAYGVLKSSHAVSHFAEAVMEKIFGPSADQKNYYCWVVPDPVGAHETAKLARAKIALLMSLYQNAKLIVCYSTGGSEIDASQKDHHDTEAGALLASFPDRCELRSSVADLAQISPAVG